MNLTGGVLLFVVELKECLLRKTNFNSQFEKHNKAPKYCLDSRILSRSMYTFGSISITAWETYAAGYLIVSLLAMDIVNYAHDMFSEWSIAV